MASSVRTCPRCKGAGGGQTWTHPDGSDLDWEECDACDGLTGWQIQVGDEWVGLLVHVDTMRENIAEEIRSSVKARESWNMESLAALVERGDLHHYRTLSTMDKLAYWKANPA